MKPVASMLSVEVELVSEHPEGNRFDQSRLAALATHVLCQEQVSGEWSVAVVLVDDEKLRLLHDQFMGVPTVTDVMTFPYSLDVLGGGVAGGDIVISLDRAGEQGPEHGFSGERETLFLFVHGLLHLAGWDDETSSQREAMLLRQESLLKAFENNDVLAG